MHNAGDRPVQVGSHFHFAQANGALEFDRSAAHGLRLDIAAGTAVRFEPGVREVTLVPIRGARVVPGLTMPPPGALDADPGPSSEPPPPPPLMEISRARYASCTAPRWAIESASPTPTW